MMQLHTLQAIGVEGYCTKAKPSSVPAGFTVTEYVHP